jgi:hypothetical protein
MFRHLLTVILLSSLGCSSSSSTYVLDSSSFPPLATVLATKVPGEVPVYQIESKHGNSLTPVYATSVKECKKNMKPQEAALRRQLLIGFRDILVLHEEEIDAPTGKFSKTEATAVAEENEVYLVSYLNVQEGCVTDIVFWSFDKEGLDAFRGDPLNLLASQIASEAKWKR